MARNTSFALTDHFAEFVDAKVREGRYGSASDVIRAGLRLLEEEEAKLERLRALIAAGDASGYSDGWDFDGFLAEVGQTRTA